MNTTEQQSINEVLPDNKDQLIGLLKEKLPEKEAEKIAEQLIESKQAAEAKAQVQAHALTKKIQREFKDWKKAICKMITNKSSLSFNRHDGSYEFVLPAELVKIVWGVTLKERARYLQLQGSASPMKDAIASLQDELKAVETQLEEQKKNEQQVLSEDLRDKGQVDDQQPATAEDI